MKSLTPITFLLVLLISASVAFGQKAGKDRFDLGVERAKMGAEVLREVGKLSEGKGVPKEVAEKALIVGVVPDASRVSLLFSRATRGHGLMSVRGEDKTWSLPAYCRYYSAPGFKFSSVGAAKLDTIFIVAGDYRIGPVPVTDEEKAEAKAGLKTLRIYTYAFTDGELKLITDKPFFDRTLGFGSFFKDSPGWGPDKAMNKAVYGTKAAAEIYNGKLPDNKTPDPALTGLRDAVNELFPSI